MTSPAPEDRLVGAKEAGRVLGFSAATVYRHAEVMGISILKPMPGARRREVRCWRLSDLYDLMDRWQARTREAS